MSIEAKVGQNQFRRELAELVPLLTAYAVKLTKSRHEGQDLAQQTMLRALESEHQFELGTNMKAWLFIILKNANIVRVSGDVRRNGILQKYYHPTGTTKPDQEDALLYGEALSALNRIPEDLRTVVVGSALGDSLKQQAEKLKIPQGTVKSRIYRGREALARAVVTK